MDLLVLGANVVCWGAIVVVWIAAAVRDAGTPRDVRVRGSTEIGLVVLAVVAVAAILLVGRSILAPFTLEATWARMIGAGVLVGSTLFAIWARLALGGSWSVGPLASTERGVRMDGPYAITRHPIYTGLLGMLLGSAILGGLGQWLVLFASRPRRRRAQDPVRGTTPPRDVSRRLRGLPRTGAAVDPGMALAICPAPRTSITVLAGLPYLTQPGEATGRSTLVHAPHAALSSGRGRVLSSELRWACNQPPVGMRTHSSHIRVASGPTGRRNEPSGAIFTVFNSVRAICVPSSDPVFQRVVHGVLMSKSITSTRELEDELRELYPAVRVRRRELSGENGVTWYVYREADFPSSQP